MNVKELRTESVNWVIMAPDGVQLANDEQFNEQQDITTKYTFYRDTVEERCPQTRHNFVEMPQF